MVGIRTWPITEIIWILEKWRDKWKLQDLVDRYVLEFPNSNRNSNRKTLRTGIQYVWDKYSRDPSYVVSVLFKPHPPLIHVLMEQSYNHEFSQEEIWFIMVNSYGVKGSAIKDVLDLFKGEFPNHDWKVYVHELLAIEASIAKHHRELPYVFPGMLLGFYGQLILDFDQMMWLTLGFAGTVFNGNMMRSASSWRTN